MVIFLLYRDGNEQGLIPLPLAATWNVVLKIQKWNYHWHQETDQKHIQLTKSITRNTCLCSQHTNMAMLLEQFILISLHLALNRQPDIINSHRWLLFSTLMMMCNSRKDTRRKFLDQTLNLKTMYQLYLNYLQDQDVKKVVSGCV